jgi:hypothetical protein
MVCGACGAEKSVVAVAARRSGRPVLIAGEAVIFQ